PRHHGCQGAARGGRNPAQRRPRPLRARRAGNLRARPGSQRDRTAPARLTVGASRWWPKSVGVFSGNLARSVYITFCPEEGAMKHILSFLVLGVFLQCFWG